MNFRRELELIHGRTFCSQAAADLTKPYRIANGIGIDSRISESDKLAILEIERAKLNQQTALSEPVILADAVEPEPVVIALPVKQSTTKTRNKTKRESRFNQFTAIAFSVTGKTGRQHISLEPEYMKALELIAPANRNQWLSDKVADYIAKNGIESTTRIVKASIVNALIERVKK
jgi:hypothetical protein